MYTQDDNQKDHIAWLNDPKPYFDYKEYNRKTVLHIRRYGNGEALITFTDGTRLHFSVENPESGDDLYSKTETEFNFDKWMYKEDEK